MSSGVKPIPEGFHTVTPHIVVSNAAEAIEFYKRALGAEEIFRSPEPGGKIMHAEIKIGDSFIFLCDEFPEMGSKSPKTLGGSATSLNLYVEDADQLFNKAVEAGATPIMPIMDAFWGDRYGMVTDPYGHVWAIATHIKDMTPEEIAEASKQYFSQSGGTAA